MGEDVKNRDLDMIKKHCNDLKPYFDTVQIFATRHEPVREDGTVNVNWGLGNWFARIGFVRSWLIREDAAERETNHRDGE